MAIGTYWSNVIKVSGGVMAGQIVGIAGYLLLTWLFTPAAFGTYASWLAFVALGSVVSSFGLETSLVQDDDGEARHHATSAILASILFGAAIYTAGVAIFLSFFPALLGEHKYSILATIWIAVISLSAATTFQSWAAAEGQFQSLTRMRVFQSIAIVALPLAAAMISRAPIALIAGHTVGLILTFSAWLRVFGRPEWPATKPAAVMKYWEQRQRTFRFVLPALTIGAFVGNIPQLAVNARFGSEIAGYLALALRVLGTPISLIGVAVRDVFRRYATIAFRERGECRREFSNSFLILTAVAIVFGVIMFALSEPLFVFVFGERWRPSGIYARYLLPMAATGIVASPLTYLVYIVRREDFDLYWQSAMLIILVAVFGFVTDIRSTLNAYAWTYVAMYVAYLFACWRFSKSNLSEHIWRDKRTDSGQPG